MRTKLAAMATFWTVLGLLQANCAPGVAPVSSPKTTAPASGPATPAPTAAPAMTPSAGQPKYGGTLKLFSFADPGGLDPHQETSMSIISLIGSSYSGLVQYDPLQSDKIVGDLAEKWEISPDGSTYTFHLFKGVKFQNGKPATAQDAKFSLDRVRQPPKGTRSPRSNVLQPVSNIAAPDENTLVLTLAQPAASLMANLAISWMTVVSRDFVEAKGDLTKDVMGTGPFAFKSYSPGVAYEATRFADYFVKGRPYLDGITFHIIKDGMASLSAFRTGNIMRTLPGAWAIKHSQAEALKKEMGDKIRIQSVPTTSFWSLQLNLEASPWKDARARRAANLALDRPAAVKIIAEGQGDIGGPMMPVGVWALPQEELLKMPGYRADKAAEIAEAKKLLAEAVPAGGVKTDIKCPTGPNCEAAVFFKDQLTKAGIDASVQVLDKAVHTRDIADGRFSASVQRQGAVIDDPDYIFGSNYVTGGGQNYSKLSDPKLDELYARQTRSVDAAERKKLVLEMQRLVIDANAMIVLFWNREDTAFFAKVKDLEMVPSYYTNHKYQNVWLAE